MPFTPFHFGPAAAIKAVIPRYFSFTVFCFAQVVTDSEVAYYMIRGEFPLHRWFHTYLGATAVAAFSFLLGRPICQLALRLWLAWPDAPLRKHIFAGGRISLLSALTAAFIGTYSHVFLDSFMHSDIEPFKPWSTQNPLYGLLGLSTLHALCIMFGIAGVWFVASHPTKET
jgi:hypothetical protein